MVAIKSSKKRVESREKKKKNKNSRYLLLSTLYFFIILTACSSEKDIAEQASAIQKTDPKEVSEAGLPAGKAEMRKFSLVSRTTEGEKEWQITGDKAAFLSDNKIKLDNVRAETSRNENTLVMTSKQGFFDRKSKDVRLEGDVKGTFVQEKNITTITCDGPLEIDNLKKEATFKENVVVCSEEGRIFADKIEIFFNEEDKKIIKIVASGNVQIEREGNRSYSEKAVYFTEQKRIILTGSPRVEIINTDNTD